MKDWFYAFFMAWGMFLAIPCPFPRWRESARGRMLMCLPLIGLVEGGLWALLVWLLAKLCLPEALGALCAAAFPWLVTGFGRTGSSAPTRTSIRSTPCTRGLAAANRSSIQNRMMNQRGISK